MNNNAIEALHHRTFESIKQTSETGAEYWSARALQPLLEYGTWDKFRRVIDKAAEACERSGNVVADHFSQVGKMVELGFGAQRALEDFHLSRYACYLIVQNGDPSKPVIANGQTYFAMQTRRQELADEATFARFGEDEKRLAIRNELATHNKHLAAAAKEAGVETPIEYAVFQDHGYKGLYGGLGNKEIHAKKGLKKNQKILDHMGSTELAANLFRATQTEEKLRRDGIKGKQHANRTHHEVGKKVRQTIQELGGTMPEELPTPETSIKQLQLGQKKLPK
ncbi:DNA damage-inducible protein D [Burkholderia pseudomallei]|uniref:DNA damage-inducible protein D n=1 Tax=Burkholderia pseudomallei TaxID=28450 RepID=UPI0009E224A4|nr:DNA damage-inducible protein D [Burkholderia pseudomallei]MCS6598556.1 DNA damage-inducible protein D [Burkholderia pseudomallei]